MVQKHLDGLFLTAQALEDLIDSVHLEVVVNRKENLAKNQKGEIGHET